MRLLLYPRSFATCTSSTRPVHHGSWRGAAVCGRLLDNNIETKTCSKLWWWNMLLPEAPAREHRLGWRRKSPRMDPLCLDHKLC